MPQTQGRAVTRRALPLSKRVLVLVDFINPLDFPGSENIVAEALAAAKATARLKRRLAEQGIPTVYANDNYGTWQSDFRDVLAHCLSLPGERGEMARVLMPTESDLTVLKPRHSAFFATPLDLLLREMKAEELILAGLATDMCVQFTTVDAYMHGYSVWVPSDCTAAESETAKATALGHMANVMKCSTRRSSGRLPF